MATKPSPPPSSPSTTPPDTPAPAGGLWAAWRAWVDAQDLGPTGRKVLKSTHVSFSAVWIGAAVVLVLVQAINTEANADHLAGLTVCMKLVDTWVIIPAAVGSFITGIGYGIWTKWGFFKFYWVIVKWVATVAFSLFGAAYLGPWISGMDAIALDKLAASLTDPEYLANRLLVAVWGAIQTVLLVGLVFLSILKPWGMRPGAAPARRTRRPRARTRTRAARSPATPPT